MALERASHCQHSTLLYFSCVWLKLHFEWAHGEFRHVIICQWAKDVNGLGKKMNEFSHSKDRIIFSHRHCKYDLNIFFLFVSFFFTFLLPSLAYQVNQTSSRLSWTFKFSYLNTEPTCKADTSVILHMQDVKTRKDHHLLHPPASVLHIPTVWQPDTAGCRESAVPRASPECHPVLPVHWWAQLPAGPTFGLHQFPWNADSAAPGLDTACPSKPSILTGWVFLWVFLLLSHLWVWVSCSWVH